MGNPAIRKYALLSKICPILPIFRTGGRLSARRRCAARAVFSRHAGAKRRLPRLLGKAVRGAGGGVPLSVRGRGLDFPILRDFPVGAGSLFPRPLGGSRVRAGSERGAGGGGAEPHAFARAQQGRGGRGQYRYNDVFHCEIRRYPPGSGFASGFFWVRRVPAGGEMGGELAARRGFGGGTRKPQSEIFSAESVNFPANRADTLNAVFAVALFFENLCLTCRKL